MTTENFAPGTITKKTPDQIYELIRAAFKNQRPSIDVKEIRPVISAAQGVTGPTLVGFEIIHAEPAPRKERSDKGLPRPAKSRAQTDDKATQDTRSAAGIVADANKKPGKPPTSPFAAADQKAAS